MSNKGQQNIHSRGNEKDWLEFGVCETLNKTLIFIH